MLKADQKSRAKRLGWGWLLILPYIGLLFPQLYARETPALLGFPFFYWYQFLWVPITAVLVGLVYWRNR